MAKIQGFWLAVCCGGLVLTQAAHATDPPDVPVSAVRDEATAHQNDRARQLIQERAAKVARDRAERMAARKRAGISLLRPVRTLRRPIPSAPFTRIDRGIRLDR